MKKICDFTNALKKPSLYAKFFTLAWYYLTPLSPLRTALISANKETLPFCCGWQIGHQFIENLVSRLVRSSVLHSLDAQLEQANFCCEEFRRLVRVRGCRWIATFSLILTPPVFQCIFARFRSLDRSSASCDPAIILLRWTRRYNIQCRNNQPINYSGGGGNFLYLRENLVKMYVAHNRNGIEPTPPGLWAIVLLLIKNM